MQPLRTRARTLDAQTTSKQKARRARTLRAFVESGTGGAGTRLAGNYIMPAMNGDMDPADAASQMRDDLQGQVQ